MMCTKKAHHCWGITIFFLVSMVLGSTFQHVRVEYLGVAKVVPSDASIFLWLEFPNKPGLIKITNYC